jgi:nitroimidazol reductase NimA-like FMN-containing flavoprotein (pyridoxamine 5'-phosphate oxidase superfamily)
MPRTLSEQERDAFLAEPHIAVLSVARDNGLPPLAAPTWYGSQPGGAITIFTETMGRKARKTELIHKAGVVSLCVQRESFPYRYVTVEGRVAGVDRPPSAEQMLAILRRYLPEEQARGFVDAELSNPASRIVLFTIEPERWLSLDFADEAAS